MSFTKRTIGDLNLTTVGNGNVVVTAANNMIFSTGGANNTATFTVSNFIIQGNLTTTGSQTVINTTELHVADNVMVLNSNVSGAPTTNAGVLINRGSSANVYIHWNEQDDKWQLYDGTILGNVATTTGANAFITKVADDLTPNLGGNLNANGYSFVSSVVANLSLYSLGNINLSSNGNANTYAIVANGFTRWPEQSLDNPAAIGSNVWVFSKNISTSYGTTLTGGGGTGLYFINTAISDELVSKRKAIFYSLIF